MWGFEPVIYWLADREPASRFIYDVPQRASWNRERARAGLLADLARSRPAAFVVEHSDVFSFVTGDSLDSSGALETFPELAALLAREYVFHSRIDDLEIYVRGQ